MKKIKAKKAVKAKKKMAPRKKKEMPKKKAKRAVVKHAFRDGIMESKVAKGVEIPTEKLSKIKEKAGSSNTGKYKNVPASEFAGAAGGSSKYSYPINTKKRAKAALVYSRNAPNPAGIKKKVYAKYPSLAKNKKK